MTAIIFGQLTSLFIIMFAGYFFTKLKVLDAHMIKGLSALITKLMLPALVFGSMQMPYSAHTATTMGLAAIGMALTVIGGALITWVFLKWYKGISKSEAGVWMCVCAFPNCLYIGKPLMEAMYGSSVLYVLSAMAMVFNVLCFSVGVYLMTTGREGSTGGVKAFFSSLLSPTIIAGVLGILMYFFSISLPSPVLNAINMLSGMLTPVSMLIIGYTLVGVSFKELAFDKKLYIISALRLIVCPTILILVMRLFIHDETLLNIMLISICLPVAAMTGVLSEMYDNPHAALCSKVIVLSTVLSLGTVPLVFSILS